MRAVEDSSRPRKNFFDALRVEIFNRFIFEPQASSGVGVNIFEHVRRKVYSMLSLSCC